MRLYYICSIFVRQEMFKKSDNRNVRELSIKTLKAKLLNLNKRLLKLLINSLYKKLQLHCVPVTICKIYILIFGGNVWNFF